MIVKQPKGNREHNKKREKELSKITLTFVIFSKTTTRTKKFETKKFLN